MTSARRGWGSARMPVAHETMVLLWTWKIALIAHRLHFRDSTQFQTNSKLIVNLFRSISFGFVISHLCFFSDIFRCIPELEVLDLSDFAGSASVGLIAAAALATTPIRPHWKLMSALTSFLVFSFLAFFCFFFFIMLFIRKKKPKHAAKHIWDMVWFFILWPSWKPRNGHLQIQKEGEYIFARSLIRNAFVQSLRCEVGFAMVNSCFETGMTWNDQRTEFLFLVFYRFCAILRLVAGIPRNRGGKCWSHQSLFFISITLKSARNKGLLFYSLRFSEAQRHQPFMFFILTVPANIFQPQNSLLHNLKTGLLEFLHTYM